MGATTLRTTVHVINNATDHATAGPTIADTDPDIQTATTITTDNTAADLTTGSLGGPRPLTTPPQPQDG